MFRLDKTAFKSGKIADQNNNVAYWLNKTPIERLEAAWFLTCHAYGIDYKDPPKLDKMKFSKRSRN